MAISSEGYADLVKGYAADGPGTLRRLKESFSKRELRADEFDIGRLFEACYGWHEYRKCKSLDVPVSSVIGRNVVEGPGAVSTSNFLNITGQIVYSAVLDRYEYPDFVFQKLIPDAPTQFLDGEKIAGVTNIGDEALRRRETEPYTQAGVTEDWVFTPPIEDWGAIVSLTWEAVFADRTGQLLDQAGRVGEALGLRREKLAIDCLIDENTTNHRYNWRGTVIASYGNNSGTHTWDNLEASNALLDWTDIDNADQLFYGMTDPYTGEPFPIMPRHLVCTKQLEKTALRILNATEIRVATPGYATTGNPTLTNVANPLAGKFEVVSSQLVAPRLATDTTWFYGDVAKYAKRMVAQPLQVVQAPANNEKEFNNQIVSQFRANERYAHVVVQPRAMVTCTA